MPDHGPGANTGGRSRPRIAPRIPAGFRATTPKAETGVGETGTIKSGEFLSEKACLCACSDRACRLRKPEQRTQVCRARKGRPATPLTRPASDF